MKTRIFTQMNLTEEQKKRRESPRTYVQIVDASHLTENHFFSQKYFLIIEEIYYTNFLHEIESIDPIRYNDEGLSKIQEISNRSINNAMLEMIDRSTT